MDQAMIQVLPLPRQLPRHVIWSIYAVTGLGLLVAIVVVVSVVDDRQPSQSDREMPPRELPQHHQDNTRENVPAKQLLPHPYNNSSAEKNKRRRQQTSRPRNRRPGFVTLEEIVAYECHFQAVYQNTTWMEGSDTEISYLDALGQSRMMNVALEQSNPLETAEQRIVPRNLRWVGNDVEEMPSDDHIAIRWNCREIEGCTLLLWIPRISDWVRCPWYLPGVFTFIPHSGRRDVDPQRHRGITATSISRGANGLWLSSRSLRSRRGAAEWKERVQDASSLQRNYDYDYEADKVHVTKMILGAGTTLFVAAPISNVSLRFVYGGEPLRCLTCPGDDAAAAGLECLSSDALLSRNARYYILYCTGPEVPWTAVVSTQRHEIIYRLANQEDSRELYASRLRPVTRELEVKLDEVHNARVRLHLPADWKDKTRRDGQCNERLRLLLRIADEQDAQMVDARFDFSLTTYLTTVKGYAVVYADVRGSRFLSYEFRHLRFRRRELMQMADYAKVVAHVATHFECIEDDVIGVFGENYGGHMALNLAADNDEDRNTSSDDKFRCCVALNPLARWQDYVYPFTIERQHSSGVTGALRRKMFKRHYMGGLVSRLLGKNFALHTSPSRQRRYYTSVLLKMLNNYGVKFERRHHDDESARMCNSRLEAYEQASDFFDRCFGREIDD